MREPIPNTERRCRVRLPACCFPVQVTTPEGEEPGYLVDLSFGGLFVSCSSVKPPGTALELRVRTPSLSRGLALRGRVVWTAPPTSGKAGGMGIALEI